MPENQEDIDALLAEVSTLADEAAADIAGDESSPSPQAGQTQPPGLIGEPAPPPTGQPPAAEGTAGHSAGPSPGAAAPTAGPPARYDEDPRRILGLEVPVIVRLAETTMALSEIVGLSTGAIIEFDKLVDSHLDLMINNKCIGHGQAVKVGENFGLRVTDVGSVCDRIKAMGDQ